MNQIKSKGGRGYKAPYKSKTMRIPIPLENAIDRFCDEYRLNPEKFTEPEELILKAFHNKEPKPAMDVDEALVKVRAILRQRKSAKQSIKKLLHLLFADDNAKEKIDNF